METNKIKFSDCNREYLEDKFELQQKRTLPFLSDWLNKRSDILYDEYEIRYLTDLQVLITDYADTWNEYELIEYFIGPILTFVNFNTPKFKIFSYRKISAKIEGVELYGEPDAIIATGKFNPKLPYFCMNEYKHQNETKGDPAGQALAAMLVAQELNKNNKQIYGVYVTGKFWNFMILKNKEYAISKTFVADDEEIFDIFCTLKALKNIIMNFD